MTQKDKEPLLKDLYARLLYGFIIHRYYDNVDICINNMYDFSHFLECSEGEEFKPYLRPMSSMTKEEYEEYYNISYGITNIGSKYRYYDLCDWLNEHHFDYRGLIEKGLALEAPEGMYK